MHTFGHFNRKTCSKCEVHLIEIGNEWYELHSISNCQNNSHAHTNGATHTQDNADESLIVKLEPQMDVAVDHSDDFLNVKTEVESSEFGEIFAENLNDVYEIYEDQRLDSDLTYSDSQSGFQFTCHVAHNRNEKGEIKFNCVDCGKIFKTLPLLNEHKRNAHPTEYDLTCKICGQTRPTRKLLFDHMKRHKEAPSDNHGRVEQNGPVEDLCDDQEIEFEFDSYSPLQNHSYSSDNSNEDKLQGSSSPKCPVNDIQELAGHHKMKKEHLITPSEEKHQATETSHMCTVCGKIFTDKYKLKCHEQYVHSDGTSSCDICGKEFANKYRAIRHIKSKHIRKPERFKCDIEGCEDTFAQSRDIKRHKARKHGMVNARHQCTICFREFPDSLYHLKRHLKAHAKNTAKDRFPKPKPKPKSKRKRKSKSKIPTCENELERKTELNDYNILSYDMQTAESVVDNF